MGYVLVKGQGTQSTSKWDLTSFKHPKHDSKQYIPNGLLLLSSFQTLAFAFSVCPIPYHVQQFI